MKTDVLKGHLIDGLFIFSAILIIVWVYLPTINAGYILDDYVHMQSFGIVAEYNDWWNILKTILTNPSGPLGRPVSIASFFISDFSYPSDPSIHRLLNISLHIINALLITWVLFLLLTFSKIKNSFYIGLSVALLWAINPMNAGPLVSVIQRMTSLSALFGLVAMVLFLKWRTRDRFQSWDSRDVLVIASLILLLVLSALSKESGALFVGYLLIVELAISKASARKEFRPKWSLLVGFCVFVYLASVTLINFYYLVNSDSWLFREFSKFERISSQLVIVPNYLIKIASFSVSNVGLISGSSGVSEWFVLSKVALALIVWTALLLVFLKGSWYARLLVLFFLNGHLLESGFAPLELYFEHRNYVASIVVILAIVMAIFYLAKKVHIIVWILVPFILLLSTLFHFNNKLLQDPIAFASYSYAENPDSVRAEIGFFYAALATNTNVARQLAERAASFNAELMSTELNCVENGFSGVPNFRKLERIGPKEIGMVRSIVEKVTKNLCDIPATELIQSLNQLTSKGNLQPKMAQLIYFEISNVYVKLKDLDGAIRALDSAIEVQPEAYLFERKASLLASAGLFSLARQAAEKGLMAKSQCKVFRYVCDANLRKLQEVGIKVYFE